MFLSYHSFMLFKIKLLSSFVPFPLFYVNHVLNIVIYFPVLQDYYIFSFGFHIFLKLYDTLKRYINPWPPPGPSHI
jgi:hypothetical protein